MVIWYIMFSYADITFTIIVVNNNYEKYSDSKSLIYKGFVIEY